MRPEQVRTPEASACAVIWLVDPPATLRIGLTESSSAACALPSGSAQAMAMNDPAANSDRVIRVESLPRKRLRGAEAPRRRYCNRSPRITPGRSRGIAEDRGL
jgi:hypothetical protein